MATKSRRPAPPSAAARFSPATRIVAGLLAFMMVGSLIFVVVAGVSSGVLVGLLIANTFLW